VALQSAVFVVDDDEGVRDFIGVLLEVAGFADVRTYESSNRFLKEAAFRDGDCVLLDLRMPEQDGLEVQRELNRRGKRLGVIMITGHAEVPTAVKAMQAGAVDFIEKPFSNDALIASVHRALAVNQASSDPSKSEDVRRRLETLTARERDVLARVARGYPNRQIASDLGITERTARTHVSNILAKLGLTSRTQAALLAAQHGLDREA